MKLQYCLYLLNLIKIKLGDVLGGKLSYRRESEIVERYVVGGNQRC